MFDPWLTGNPSCPEKANKITIKTERAERELAVAEKARVVVDGKAAKLGDVKKGDRVTVGWLERRGSHRAH
jgi:hypothetical protein